MPNYSTYLVAGPENILPNHQLGNESKEQAGTEGIEDEEQPR